MTWQAKPDVVLHLSGVRQHLNPAAPPLRPMLHLRNPIPVKRPLVHGSSTCCAAVIAATGRSAHLPEAVMDGPVARPVPDPNGVRLAFWMSKAAAIHP